MQKYPELAGILSQKEIDDLEADIDPVTMCSDKLSALVYQTSVGPSEVSPAIFSGIDSDIKGLNFAVVSCLRILGRSLSSSPAKAVIFLIISLKDCKHLTTWPRSANTYSLHYSVHIHRIVHVR